MQLSTRALVRVPYNEFPVGVLRSAPRSAIRAQRQLFFDGKSFQAPIYDREALQSGQHFEGPAVIEEFSGTTLLPPKWTAEVRAGGHLYLRSKSLSTAAAL